MFFVSPHTLYRAAGDCQTSREGRDSVAAGTGASQSLVLDLLPCS